MTASQAEGVPATSVVMPTYNRGAGLLDFVRPLLEDPFPLEVIVVVDGSEDDSMASLQSLAESHPRLRPIWIPNSGEMGARGVGLAEAQGEVVVMLDDDVLVRPGLIELHARRHGREHGLVAIGYMPTWLPPRPTASEFATVLYAHEYEEACLRYRRDPDRILCHLWAGNISLRRDDALEVGMSNPAYQFRYHQDREFGLRCKRAGLKGAFDPALRADHFHSRGLEAFRREAIAQGAGRRRLHRLHPDLLGELRGEEASRGLRGAVRSVARASRRPLLYRACTGSLVATIRTAERFDILPLAKAAARLLRRIDQEQGILVEG
ncbi:MAG TPA: glycosyltransferase family A protein [Solirubrobacterales bacterium]